MLQTIAVATHVEYLTLEDQSIQDGCGDHLVPRKPAHSLKPLCEVITTEVFSCIELIKKQVSLNIGDRQKAHFIDHYQVAFAVVVDPALGRWRDVGCLELPDQIIQADKGDTVAPFQSLIGQCGRKMRLAHAGRTQKHDIESLVNLGAVGQPEPLLPDHAVLKAKVELFQSLLSGKVRALESKLGGALILEAQLGLQVDLDAL